MGILEREYEMLFHFYVDEVFTQGSIVPGQTDKDIRYRLRSAAWKPFRKPPPGIKIWGFQIYVVKMMKSRPIDIENVPKLIIDSFSKQKIADEDPRFERLGLYPNDSTEYVNICNTHFKWGYQDQTAVQIYYNVVASEF